MGVRILLGGHPVSSVLRKWRSERSGDFPSVPRDASSWLPPEFQVAEAGQWTHMNKVVGIRIFLGGEVVEIGQVLVLRDRRRGHMRLGIPQRR